MILYNMTLSGVKHFCSVYRLKLNVEKTCYMVFPLNKLNNVQTVVKDTEIQKVSKYHYLGIIIDDELKWTDYCQYVYNKFV
jgi:hypothetical protein